MWLVDITFDDLFNTTRNCLQSLDDGTTTEVGVRESDTRRCTGERTKEKEGDYCRYLLLEFRVNYFKFRVDIC